tara:strand:+ start:1119 stop:1349 length:231 start_codon:yes stop_codon:yes gene_type:complete
MNSLSDTSLELSSTDYDSEDDSEDKFKDKSKDMKLLKHGDLNNVIQMLTVTDTLNRCLNHKDNNLKDNNLRKYFFE